MFCHGKKLCGKKSKNTALSDGNDSEGEDMYGFLPKKTTTTTTRACVRNENIYESAPRKVVKSTKPKVVTFLNEPPKVRLIQRRHSCADNFQNYIADRYDYKPLIPIERLPSYPNSVHRSASGSSVCTHYRRPPLLSLSPVRFPPPCYREAVRRAASFSASRGINRGFVGIKQLSIVPETNNKSGRVLLSPKTLTSTLHKSVFSSTSNLYVDSSALKRTHSRDLSIASSTSSISEATVYRKIGPCDYVSVNDKEPHRKSFRSVESSSDDGVEVDVRSSVCSSTVCYFCLC